MNVLKCSGIEFLKILLNHSKEIDLNYEDKDGSKIIDKLKYDLQGEKNGPEFLELISSKGIKE